jgi:hypothetical protein
MVLIDSAVYCDHGKLIKCDFKPGSVERSIDQDKVADNHLNFRQPIKIDQSHSNILNFDTNENREFHNGIYFVSFFHGIRDILEKQLMMKLYYWKLQVYIGGILSYKS